jgi:hypothetical protein
MKRPYPAWAPIFIGVAASLFAASLPAQTTERATNQVRPFQYDKTVETTVSGTVKSVVAKPEPGMTMGGHVMLQTSSGIIDTSLGTLALSGRDPLPVAAGQMVEITGVWKTINGQPVLLARTVKIGGEVYEVRNEHGFPLIPIGGAPAAQKGAQP